MTAANPLRSDSSFDPGRKQFRAVHEDGCEAPCFGLNPGQDCIVHRRVLAP